MSVVRMPVASVGKAPFKRGDHVELASRLVAIFRARAPTTFVDGNVFRYDTESGIFKEVAPAELSRVVQSFAGVSVGENKKPLSLRATDVGGAVKLATDLLSDPEFFTNQKRSVAFTDCFVSVEPDRIVQQEHSPDHRARFAYPWPYPKHCPSPVFSLSSLT